MVERKKPPLDAAPYQAAMRRLMILVPACGVAGIAVALAALGWRHAVGVTIGVLAGWGNFMLLVRVVNSLGPGANRPARRTGFLLLGALLVLGGLGFGIIRVLGIHSEPLFAGLATPLAAVIVSIFFELILLLWNTKPG